MTVTQLLTQKLHKQVYVAPMLKSLLQKIYSRYHDLVNRYEIYISQMTVGLLISTQIVFFPLSLSILLTDLTVYIRNTAGV